MQKQFPNALIVIEQGNYKSKHFSNIFIETLGTQVKAKWENLCYRPRTVWALSDWWELSVFASQEIYPDGHKKMLAH